MGLDVWFPLAIYYEDLEDSATYNRIFLDRIENLMRAAGAHRTSPTSSWTGDVHDVDRLHLDPAFDWLTGQIGQHALHYLKRLGHDLAKTDIYIQRAWPIVARRDQGVARHAHHTAHLSAVYYVSAPAGREAGQIRFLNDSKPNELCAGIDSNMTRGYTEYNAFNYGSALYQPVPGRLLLFPAKQTHSVEPNQTDEDRIAISYDLVITGRGRPEDGHHEFLMPPPSVWRRLPRALPEMHDAPPPVATADARTPLLDLAAQARDIDQFTLPAREGHVLWSPVLLPDCASPADWDGMKRQLPPSQDWREDPSGALALWRDGAAGPEHRNAVSRAHLHLRDRDIPLDRASLTPPVLQKRVAHAQGPFARGQSHLCLYLRLDHEDTLCQLEFAESGEAMALPPGGLLLVSGLRRHRLTGASHILHLGLDLPALARPELLAMPSLQAADTADRIVFAALTAQPVTMALPPAPLLGRKLDWLDGRERRRARHESCPAVRRFLLGHADPATASPEELALIRAHGSRDSATGRIVMQDDVLSPEQCARLCRHAKAHMTALVPDTVDDLPEYQVNLTPDALRALLGPETMASLFALPAGLCPPEGRGAAHVDIFLRQYSAHTRPYITFHADTCHVTLNIALNETEDFEGGHLLALHAGTLRAIPRRAGAALLHAGNLVHGVSRIKRGTRYALILFFQYEPTRAMAAVA